MYHLHHLLSSEPVSHLVHFQRTFLGKGEAKGTPLEPRQGRSPAPPFPNSSLDFALGLFSVHCITELFMEGVISLRVHLITSRRGEVRLLLLPPPYGVTEDEEANDSQRRYPVDADTEGK